MRLLVQLQPLESRSTSVSELENLATTRAATPQSSHNIDSLKCSGDPRGRQAELRQAKLQGKRILVTRAREQAGALSERLQAVGAIAVEFPVIRIVPPQNWKLLDSALGKLFLADARNLPYYAWLVFTSANGVNIFCERLLSLGFHT